MIIPFKPYAMHCCICFLISGFTLNVRAQTANLWLTTVDRSKKFELQHPPLAFTDSNPNALLINIDNTKKYQSIDGFGYALTGGSASLLMRMSALARKALLKELFTTNGNSIGISYLRLSIGSSDLNAKTFSYDDLNTGETDPELKKFSLGPDLGDVVPVLKEILAINKNVTIMGSPWSAPLWMKTNNSIKGGRLQTQYYKVYAAYLVKYIEAMKAEGIPVNAITIQNEPLNERNTPSMQMSAEEEGSFIKTALGPAFAAAGIKTKIILFDHNCDLPGYAMSILSDTAAAKYADGSGFHLYAGTIDSMTKVHNAFPNKNLYFTEQMVVERHAVTVDMPVERLIIGATNNWSKNVLFWNLAADSNFDPHTNDGGCPICQGAITIDGDVVGRNIAYYAMAHASKFVRPGSLRISSTSDKDLPNVAFTTPDGKTVLIIVNVSSRTKPFSIGFNNRFISTTLASGSVGTYVW